MSETIEQEIRYTKKKVDGFDIEVPQSWLEVNTDDPLQTFFPHRRVKHDNHWYVGFSIEIEEDLWSDEERVHLQFHFRLPSMSYIQRSQTRLQEAVNFDEEGKPSLENLKTLNLAQQNRELLEETIHPFQAKALEQTLSSRELLIQSFGNEINEKLQHIQGVGKKK